MPSRSPAQSAAWFPVTYLLNRLNRGLGVADAYPLVLSPVVVNKSRFVYDTITQSGYPDTMVAMQPNVSNGGTAKEDPDKKGAIDCSLSPTSFEGDVPWPLTHPPEMTGNPANWFHGS